MDSQTYWKRREAKQKKINIRQEAEYQKKIDDIYKNMLENIEKEINGFYVRYARKEGITMAEARKRVSKLDIKKYEEKAKRYVKNEDLSKRANEEMRIYNLTMRVNRLEMLKADIGKHLVGGFDEIERIFGDALTGRSIDEMKRQAGILGDTIHNNTKTVDSIVNASFHNATYSDRIWMYQRMLKAELDKLLQEGLIQGKHPKELARHLEKRFGASRGDAERLMITEMSRVQTEAQKRSFEHNGYSEYQFHALGAACSDCIALDGKHFPVKDMVIAQNAPPRHPRCRCSVSAYMRRAEFEKWMDFLDKGGTTEEWKELKAKEKSDKINLSKGELYALNEYKGFKAYVLNEKLRTDGLSSCTSEEKRIIHNLDSALQKFPKYEGNLSRSVWFKRDSDLNKFLEEHSIGEKVKYPAYTSTRSEPGAHNEKAQAQMYIRNAKNGRDVSGFGAREYEVLYERNAQFIVANIVFLEGVWNILLDEV